MDGGVVSKNNEATTPKGHDIKSGEDILKYYGGTEGSKAAEGSKIPSIIF